MVILEAELCKFAVLRVQLYTIQFLNTNDVDVVFTSLVSQKKNGTPVLFAFELV